MYLTAVLVMRVGIQPIILDVFLKNRFLLIAIFYLRMQGRRRRRVPGQYMIAR